MKQDTQSSVDVALLGDLFSAYILEFCEAVYSGIWIRNACLHINRRL
jgi:hypothetical protein